MRHIYQLRTLLALDIQQLSRFNKPGDNLVFIPTRDSCFFGTHLLLLPPSLDRIFISPVVVQPPVTATAQQYRHVVRLVQENQYIRRMDFYSRQLEYDADATADSLIVLRIREKLTKGFEQAGWTRHESTNDLTMVFSHDNLEIVIFIEMLRDVQAYPFWSDLLADFHYHYPADHIPALSRYAHFVIRETNRVAK